MTTAGELHGSNALLVLGMHRSGTSALAGILHHLGVALGSSLIPAAADDNPKGFWEHQELVNLNELVLAAFGASWHDERPLPERWWADLRVEPLRQQLIAVLRRDFGSVPLWGAKDPRICRLLPLWLPLLTAVQSAPRFILILRHPLEVARSLERRNGISLDRALLLWLRYVLEAESGSRGQVRSLLTYDDLLADWRGAVAQSARDLAVALPLYDGEAAARVDAFLEAGLRHFSAPAETSAGITSAPGALAEEVYRTFRELPDGEQRRAQLAELAFRVDNLGALVHPWSGEVQYLWSVRSELALCRDRLEDRRRYAAILEAEVVRVKSSWPWRAAAPLRALSSLLRSSRAGSGDGEGS